MTQKLLKFAVSGGTAAVLGIALLYLFTGVFGMWYLPASVLAFALSMIAHFFLQKLWVFTHKTLRAAHVEFGKFFVLALVNLAINSACMYALVSLVGVNYLIAQIIIRICLAILNYFIYERMIFIKL
jgi:putative flippase GtrA